MIEKTYLYVSPEGSFDPYLNLAREEVLLRRVGQGEMILYLWQNQDTVVIGKNQNCYQECRVSLLEEEGGHLARRLSGGGAVFHDLGNLNYTFLAMREDFDVAFQTGLILEAVRSYGIEANASGRNDIEANGRKFSGNAYYLTREACYQHGTLLVSVDPGKIGRYLSVDREKLSAKGVSSVRSRVTGLVDLCPEITVDGLKTRVSQSFCGAFPEARTIILSEGEEGRRIEEEALKLREKYADPVWLYGEKTSYTYEFGKRFDWGSVRIHLDIRKGQIARTKVYTDSLLLQWPGIVEGQLTGCLFEPAAIGSALVTEDPDLAPIFSDVTNLIEESM